MSVWDGKPRKKRKRQSYSPGIDPLRTGDRMPTKHALTSTMSIFRGVPMDANEIARRINCSPDKVLNLLIELRSEGTVKVSEPLTEEPTLRTNWMMAM